MSVKAQMDQLIKEYPVFVISKSYCPFCTMAKNALKNYAIPGDKIKVMEIENNKDCGEIQDYMSQLTGARSVPRVFIGGECIGGGSETKHIVILTLPILGGCPDQEGRWHPVPAGDSQDPGRSPLQA